MMITLPLQLNGRGTGIRTPEWRDQNPLPYRLAIPLQKLQNSYLLGAEEETRTLTPRGAGT